MLWTDEIIICLIFWKIYLVRPVGKSVPEVTRRLMDTEILKLSFERPLEKIKFIEHGACKVTSWGSIAARGAWCTLGHINWVGGKTVAKHLSG